MYMKATQIHYVIGHTDIIHSLRADHGATRFYRDWRYLVLYEFEI